MHLGHLMESWNTVKNSCDGIVAQQTVSGLDMELQQPLAGYFVLGANFKLYVVSKSYKIK